MTDVRPFRGLRYDPGRVELARVLVPPYDVVTPRERIEFWERDPYNAIRLELTRDPGEEASTDYASVAETLGRWRGDGVLRADAEPAFYALRQRFVAPLHAGEGREGASLERVGFFGALRLEDYAVRIVRPHERTMSGPKADRLKLLRATRANLSPIFLLYEDREQALAATLEAAFEGETLAARDAAGTLHELAPLTAPESIAVLRSFLAEHPVVIADGHHRYETALAYRAEQRAASGSGPASAAGEAPWERTLAYFANAHAPGSLLLPIHRVILKGSAPSDAAWRERLPAWQETRHRLAAGESIADALAAHLAPLADRHAFAADDGSGTLRVFSRKRSDELSVRAIHREVIEGVFGLDEEAVRDGAVAFPKSALEAARSVREGRGAVALYLNPLTPDDVFAVTAAGEVLPQKSTFFFPKLPSGLVFRSFEDA
jgi:uncharacterized protein (DUF1015 family)